jgi:hypothetical protein
MYYFYRNFKADRRKQILTMSRMWCHRRCSKTDGVSAERSCDISPLVSSVPQMNDSPSVTFPLPSPPPLVISSVWIYSRPGLSRITLTHHIARPHPIYVWCRCVFIATGSRSMTSVPVYYSHRDRASRLELPNRRRGGSYLCASFSVAPFSC